MLQKNQVLAPLPRRPTNVRVQAGNKKTQTPTMTSNWGHVKCKKKKQEGFEVHETGKTTEGAVPDTKRCTPPTPDRHPAAQRTTKTNKRPKSTRTQGTKTSSNAWPLLLKIGWSAHPQRPQRLLCVNGALGRIRTANQPTSQKASQPARQSTSQPTHEKHPPTP